MSGTGDHGGTIDLGGLHVDLDARRLTRDGVDVPLEPKAFAVLAAMLERPGHAFGRDELLDAVWGHRHVTPGVLVRVVRLIRRALDDEDERWLQTVHGVGYRLVVPAADAGLPASSPPLPETRPRGAPESAPSRRPWRAGAAAVALVVVAVVVFVAWRDRIAAPPPLAVAAPAPIVPPAGTATLAVLPLRALGDDPRGQAFADGLSEELITTLSRIAGLRVSARSASFPFGDGTVSHAEIAARLGASHLLEGSVRQDDERLRINLRLVDVARDRALWSETYDRRFADIFAVQSEIARAVADVLRLRMVVAAQTRDEDPALYRRLLMLRQRWLSGGLDDVATYREIESELRVLVAEHPEYARAHGMLAVILAERSLRPRTGSEALAREAEAVAARALALDPASSEALSMLAGQACRAQRWSDCLARSRQVVRLSPSDVEGRVALASRLATMGYVESALAEIEEARAIDPTSIGLPQVHGRILDTLGRHDEARAMYAQAVAERSSTARLMNALWRGDLDDARAIAASHSADYHWRASELATIDALADPAHWPAALAAIDASEVAESPHGERVTYNFMRLWLPERDFARDVAGLDGTQRQGYASYQLVFWQPESRDLRRSEAFRAYVSDSGLLALWRTEGFPTMCRAAGDDDFACD